MKPALTLEETIARLRQSITDKAKNKLAEKLAKAARAKFESTADKAAALIAQQIEAELKWEPHSITLMSHKQICSCGAEFTGVDGVYLEASHRETKASRWRPLRHLNNLPRVPHQKHVIEEHIHLCPRCFVELDPLVALFDSYGPHSRQASLFPELPSQLSSLVVRGNEDDLAKPSTNILAWLK